MNKQPIKPFSSDTSRSRRDITLIENEKNYYLFDKKNYRPVSVLPTVSNVFERILLRQISNYIDNLLSHYLCGYCKGFNPQHALLTLLEKWRITLDGRAILMDLSTAFDTLDHNLLIAKLHAYGFDYHALKLIKSYLLVLGPN